MPVTVERAFVGAVARVPGTVERARVALVVVTFVLFAPATARAWGLAAHRWLTLRAADIVRPHCPSLAERPDELADYALEPDTTLRAELGRVEEVRHFLDLDHYGWPPFRALPREYGEAVRRFGRERIHEQGILPWHVGRLTRTLQAEIRGRDWRAARRTAGHLAHYAGDATMPLHATDNHDGQRTGQRGLHRRVEAKLVDARLAEYAARAERVPRRRPIAPAESEAAMFTTLLASYDDVAPLLAADRAARSGTRVSSALYYRRLDADLGALLGTRLGTAAVLIAALWEGACRD